MAYRVVRFSELNETQTKLIDKHMRGGGKMPYARVEECVPDSRALLEGQEILAFVAFKENELQRAALYGSNQQEKVRRIQKSTLPTPDNRAVLTRA